MNESIRIFSRAGFDKGRDPKRQHREIARAQRLLVQLKQRQRRQKRRRS